MNTATKTLLAVLASSFVSSTFAEQSEEILKVKKSTFVNLVDLLVQRGVINKEEGSGLVTAAEQEAASEDKRVASQAAPAAAAIATTTSTSNTADAALQAAAPGAGSAMGKNGSKIKHVNRSL
jgi:polyhydroxyalkanoate synthesis regulator phasin